MEKITVRSFIKTTFLLLMFLSAISCSSINMVAIENNTKEAIIFQGEFEHKPHAPYNMVFELKPGENNLWEYELGPLEEHKLDKGLKQITLKNERGCTIVLERDAIEKITKKEGPWIINIDKDVMACK